MQALIKKTDKVPPGSVTWQVHYALFARQGFTGGVQAWPAEYNALLIILAQIEAGMRRWLQAQR